MNGVGGDASSRMRAYRAREAAAGRAAGERGVERAASGGRRREGGGGGGGRWGPEPGEEAAGERGRHGGHLAFRTEVQRSLSLGAPRKNEETRKRI